MRRRSIAAITPHGVPSGSATSQPTRSCEQDVALVELERRSRSTSTVWPRSASASVRVATPSSRTSQPRWVSRASTILRSTPSIQMRFDARRASSESGSCVTITTSPRMPWARATPPISMHRSSNTAMRFFLFLFFVVCVLRYS